MLPTTSCSTKSFGDRCVAPTARCPRRPALRSCLHRLMTNTKTTTDPSLPLDGDGTDWVGLGYVRTEFQERERSTVCRGDEVVRALCAQAAVGGGRHGGSVARAR